MENKNSSTEGIKPTNLGPAYLRSFTDIPYSKELAELTDSKRAPFLYWNEETYKRIIPLMEGRYKAIDFLIKKNGIKQIIEIAAGWTPRGMIMTKDPSVNYIETDQDPLEMEQKRRIAEKILGEKRPNLHCILLDAISGNGLENLMNLLKPGKVCIIHEGLFRYLTHEQKAEVVRIIKKILEKHDGMYITTDVHVDKEKKLYNKSQNIVKVNEEHSKITGTNINSNYFKNDKEVKEFFNNLGFDFKTYKYPELVKEYSCIKIANLNKEAVFEFTNDMVAHELWLKSTNKNTSQ